MRETSPSHKTMISSLMEKKTNRTEMVVVNEFVANGIPMLSLMDLKIILGKMRMVDNYQAKGQGIC